MPDAPRRSPIDTQPSRRPGESLEQRANDDHFLKWAFFTGGATALILAAIISWLPKLGLAFPVHWTLTAAALILSAIAARFVITEWQTVRNILLGAKGERAVADILDQLRRERGYFIIHDIPIYAGGRFGRHQANADEQPVANIDHIAIGRAGVLVIETKARMKPPHRKAKVTFDGQRVRVDGQLPDRDPIEQARRNARDVRAMIHNALGTQSASVPVRPVALYPGWWVDEVKGQDFWLLNPERLSKWIKTEESYLGSKALNEKHAADIVQRAFPNPSPQRGGGQ